ncbi:MAG: hypothetical protein K5924_02380 [Chloroflexi bacterium]|nr:hypothetical protein [Chloroflexota bacterium]
MSILLVALLALVVSACASSESSSPSASEPFFSASAEPTQEPSDEPSEDPGESLGAIPSFDINGDPELASRFPDTVGGEAIQVISFRGDVLGSGGDIDPSFQEFLEATDADLEDVSVAFGGSQDGTLNVAAFRVLGVAEDRLEREFLSASEDNGDIEGAQRANVGGKDVWVAADATGETSASIYLYVKDDTVYFLTGTEEQAEEILSALP